MVWSGLVAAFILPFCVGRYGGICVGSWALMSEENSERLGIFKTQKHSI